MKPATTRQLLLTALVGLLATSAPEAFAFGSKRLAHVGAPEDWAKATRTLLNGTYGDAKKPKKISPVLFGPVQAGPFYELDKSNKRKWVYLTTIDKDRCHELRKPIADLDFPDRPTELDDISCDKAAEYRRDAKLPEFAGYVALSPEGRAVLSSLHDVEWRASRDCFLNGSDEDKRVFSQGLRLHFEEDMTELDIFSFGTAFSTKETSVMREWRINPIKLLMMRESRAADGSYRFLLWGERYGFATEEQNRMTVAAVNPVLMSSAETLMLYSGKRICMGESTCLKLSEVELTRLLPGRYLVLEYSPAHPEALSVLVAQADLEQPVLKISYSSRQH